MLSPTRPDAVRPGTTWSTHTHTQGLISPTLFSGTFTAGTGADTRWGLICPGALGAPHTMHYRWEGAQGGLVAPAEACVLGGGGEEEVPQPRPTVGGADPGLRLRAGGRGHKVSVPEGPSGQAYPGQKPTGRAGGHSGRRAVPLSLCPSAEGEEGSGLGQAATLSCPIPSSASQNGFDVCLKMKPRYASVFMMLAMFLQSSMPLWGRPMCCRLRPLFMSRSPFLGQQPMAKL